MRTDWWRDDRRDVVDSDSVAVQRVVEVVVDRRTQLIDEGVPLPTPVSIKIGPTGCNTR
jgi:hypothetical protein